DTQGPPGCPGLRGAWRRASWDRVAEIQPQDRLGLRPPSLHQSAGAPLSATVRDEAGFTRRSDLIGGLEGNNLVREGFLKQPPLCPPKNGSQENNRLYFQRGAGAASGRSRQPGGTFRPRSRPAAGTYWKNATALRNTCSPSPSDA